MHTLGRVLAVITMTLTATLAWAGEAAWRLEKDQDGVQVYSRAVAGWGIREMRGVTRIQARLSSVVAVINDVSAISELNDMVSEASLQHQDSGRRYQIYSVTNMPWPLSDRDIMNQREITQDERTLVVTITDTATHGQLPLKDGRVRIVKCRQQWTLTPDQSGGVTVEARTLADLAGPIPAAVINSMSLSVPRKTLLKLKEMARRAKYARATLDFVREPSLKKN